jgi:hypothetical protein
LLCRRTHIPSPFEVEFGSLDRRTLADFRRSGAVEGIAGKADPAHVAHAMGNTLDSSNTLFATYVPVNLATIRQVAEARRRGRAILRGGHTTLTGLDALRSPRTNRVQKLERDPPKSRNGGNDVG